MELLLNLAWLLMALPAYWLWRKRTTPGPRERVCTGLQCLLALGCMLILLFPVISATDDLHAMRCEVEEPGANKRAVRQAGSDKTLAAKRVLTPPALLASVALFPAPLAELHQASIPPVSPLSRPCLFHRGRAPPSFLLG
jgi:uncharacterized iron-regulated membrane protein